MKRILFSLLAMLVALVLVTPAHATLINRGMDMAGNRLIYDDDLDITWYDFSNTAGNWASQVGWAGDLSIDLGGTIYDDWRLTDATNQDGSGPDGGFNVTGSEMGHLYYTELGNAAGGPLNNTGDFQNLLSTFYWSGTEFRLPLSV